MSPSGWLFWVTASLVIVGVPAEASHYKAIQPGALLGHLCTMNLVFEDDTGAKYIGIADHCGPALGGRVIAPTLGEFGTMVFSSPMTLADLENGTQMLDFGLIRIDDDKHSFVDPSVRGWGGPVGVATDPMPGTITLHHGQGLLYDATEPSRNRMGVFQYIDQDGAFKDWYHGTFPFLGGDSGSPVLTADGQALGIVSTVAATFFQYEVEPAGVGGPTFEFIVRSLAEAGLNVTLVTAPFVGPSASFIQDVAEHCMDAPASSPTNPDACVRTENYDYHWLGVNATQTDWEIRPRALMAAPDPRFCDRGPYFPTWLVQPCQQDILILETAGSPVKPEALRLNITWPSADNDLDLYLYDSANHLVSASMQRTGNVESIVLPDPVDDHYRVVVVAVRYVNADTEQELGANATLSFARTAGPPEPRPTQSASGIGILGAGLALLATIIVRRRN